MTAIDRGALEALRAKHLAFVEARPTGAEAEAAWRDNVAKVVEALLDAPLGEVLPADVVGAALERLLTGPGFDAFAKPIAVAVERLILAELANAGEPIGDHVPPEARRALSRLLTHRGLAPERLIREVCQQDATRELMREVLSDALREFQTKVNPFSADWGLPAILKKLSPFGLGKGLGLDGFRADFERRLEPEMKKFLQGASRHALTRMAEMTVAKWDEPSFVALREELLRWALAQPVRDLSKGIPADVFDDGREASLAIARAALLDPKLGARRRALLHEAIAPHADKPVRDVLKALGIEPVIDAAAIADLGWPLVRTALASPAARAWFASLVAEFYDAELAALAPSKSAPE